MANHPVYTCCDLLYTMLFPQKFTAQRLCPVLPVIICTGNGVSEYFVCSQVCYSTRSHLISSLRGVEFSPQEEDYSGQQRTHFVDSKLSLFNPTFPGLPRCNRQSAEVFLQMPPMGFGFSACHTKGGWIDKERRRMHKQKRKQSPTGSCSNLPGGQATGTILVFPVKAAKDSKPL